MLDGESGNGFRTIIMEGGRGVKEIFAGYVEDDHVARAS